MDHCLAHNQKRFTRRQNGISPPNPLTASKTGDLTKASSEMLSADQSIHILVGVVWRQYSASLTPIPKRDVS